MDLYCGSLSIFINLIDLFQNQKLWNFDPYQAKKVAIGDGHTCPRGRSSVQFCPLLLYMGVWNLCLSKKLKGQDLCTLSLDPQLQH